MLGIAAGIAGGAILLAVPLSLVLRVDREKALEIALEQTGGGQVLSEEVSREGLWNEYSYVIVNGGQWYELELNAFGMVTEMERSSGQGGWS